jgi:hypothetical protein
LKSISKLSGINDGPAFVWTHQADFALRLSHDVDTAIGQKNVLVLAQIEVPVTMPYEGEMMALGFGSEARAKLWRTKATWILR